MLLRPHFSLCLLLAASGCHLILGSEDFTDQPSAGSGGTGGSGNGTPTGGSPPTDGGGGSGASTNEGGMTTSGGGEGGEGGAGGGPCETGRTPVQRSLQETIVMLDRSGSMIDNVLPSGTRYSAQTGGLQDYVSSAAASGNYLAVGFFPVLDGGGQSSCDVAEYSTPVVDFTEMPDANGPIATEIAAYQPEGSSTLAEPMQGAIDIASERAQNSPQSFVSVVVITDAEPNTCIIDQATLTSIAAAGYAADPRVETFIIGMESTTPDLLNAISAAGNGGVAYIIPDADDNARQAVFDALNDIWVQDHFCGLNAPEDDPDPSKVNLLLTNMEGQEVTVPHVADPSACPGDDFAWYYDSVGRVRLCGDSCNYFLAPDQGTLEFVLGCDTIELDP